MPDPVIEYCSNPPKTWFLVEDLQRARLARQRDGRSSRPTCFITAMHNGGLVVGAFLDEELVGFVFGFPGIEFTPDGPRPKHCSHMLGHPARAARCRRRLRAEARAVADGPPGRVIDHITWTYDPLLSRNAYLNIAKLGAVCNTYRRSEYGDLRDGLNAGLPSDRFQADWWIHTRRVERRLGKRRAPSLEAGGFFEG
jgi:predicted GNAT superfamily acetyltransferase